MDISILLKVAGVGMLVSVACQILSKSGREEQATLVSIMIMGQLSQLITTVKTVFGL